MGNFWKRLGPGILLAAVVNESGCVAGGFNWLDHINKLMTAILGRWMYHVFMLTAFFAMFSTSYVVFFSAALAAVMIVWVGNPVTLVVAASLVSLAAAPVLHGLSLSCVRHHIEDPQMRPHALTVMVGWLGVAFVCVALGVTIYSEFIIG